MSIPRGITAAPIHTPEWLVRQAVALRPVLLANQAETERRTYYSERLHRAFLAAGFYRTLVPHRYGGLEFDVPTFLRLLIELARGCASTAWCLGLAAGHSLQVGSYFEERAQEELFGDGDFRAAAVTAPTVTASENNGGWSLSGKVGYCSGIPYSTHFLGQAVPAHGTAESPLLYVAPRSEWTMLDDWGDSLGLRGSGSHSIQFRDSAWIPQHWAIPDLNVGEAEVSDGTPGLRLHGNPLYAGRSRSVFTMTIAALAVGTGYQALDAYEEQLRTRRTCFPPVGPRLADPDYQRWYGAAFARLATARAALLHCADEHMALCARGAHGGEPYGALDEQRLAAIAREVTVQVWDIVAQELLRTVGATVLAAGTWFERVHRDLSTIISHRNVSFRDPLHRGLAQLHLGIAPIVTDTPGDRHAR
ncbi:acyl-CoA dehydrogenase family protein [Amycolatopsis speibonae]|uniref:Acyl-CoA dehydrogenase family protein n=1 Tax=Amycolatopsis speibonae TaxID=1450224 RepID=A0ABV7PB45_9PSEU